MVQMLISNCHEVFGIARDVERDVVQHDGVVALREVGTQGLVIARCPS